MFKQFFLLIVLSFSNPLFAQNVEQLLAPTVMEQSDSSDVQKVYEGEISGQLYDSILNETQNESWAKVISDAFKDEFTTAKGLRVDARYSFNVDANERVTYARLIVGGSLLDKELKIDEASGAETYITKQPDLELREFLLPVKSERVSSQFNLTRKHPVKRRRIQPHRGIDFTARSGTPIYPSLDGVVIAIGRARAKGKFILIEHNNGMKTTYDHLRKFKKGLRVGDYVEVSEQIGEVGRTGYSTGAHLHFGLINTEGLYVNPILYLKDYQIDTETTDSSTSELQEAALTELE